MYSVLDEILKLRKGKSLRVDTENSDRYRLVIGEDDGTKTAYCFSAPIYNDKTGKLVDMNFRKEDNSIIYNGSRVSVKITDKIILENEDGVCSVFLNGSPEGFSGKEAIIGNDCIRPSLNGVLYKASCKNGKIPSFKLEVSNPFFEARANNKYFALMNSEFRPFFVISSIKCVYRDGKIGPAVIGYNKISGKDYEVSVRPASPFGEYVFFEINLYEEKLFQDTTVESGNPDMNNSFGGTAFIGKTAEFGEQWLYTRLDLSKVQDLANRNISSVNFHIPKLSRGHNFLTAFKLSDRFCSFGSTWESKTEEAEFFTESKSGESFHSIDITSLVTSGNTRHFIPSEGLIIKSGINGAASLISTGDSSFHPQILEIKYS